MKIRTLALVTLISLLLAGFSFPREAHAAGTFCHTVKRGENVTQIAQMYGVTVAAIQQANNLWNPSLIYVGQCLLIPTQGATQPSGCTQIHVVQRGEYLKLIAAQYGVSVAAIVQANGLSNPNFIYTGQRLYIPCTYAPPPPPPPPPAPKPGCTSVYVVKAGEYLKTIAARYHVDMWDIVRLNGLANPNYIYTGQRLRMPCKEEVEPKPKPTPVPSSLPWTGEYWNNRLLSGDPKLTRKDALVNFNFGTSGPGDGIGGTNFSVRWTRTRYFDPGTYRFYVNVDDGVRVWVDGVPIIDEWHDSAPTTYTAVRQLSAGNYKLQVDYYQHDGAAQIQFYPEKISAPGAWTAAFFNNMSLKGTPTITRTYDAVDFDFGNKSPIDAIAADYFSIRFTGNFYFTGGNYHFSAKVDDGVRVYLDDNLIIDHWQVGAVRTFGADVDVSEGKHNVKVEYFENTGGAVVKVIWIQN
jgi:LysM repeat protein